ncbi:MAG: hypothetical protein O7G88_02725, partial [bacterium]|nr:hypothetical protein [bacterium]
PTRRPGWVGPHFAIDHAKAEAEARFDGITVLRTNTRLGPLQAMLRYRRLMLRRLTRYCYPS